jgi:PAX-interacting protein 1
MPAEQLQKLKHYKDVLHRMIPYLRVPKEKVPKEFNLDKVEAFEKQIVSIMETFKKRRQPAQPSLSGGPASSAQSQPGAPANSGQSQQQQTVVGQQSDLSTLPKGLPQLQPQQQQQQQQPQQQQPQMVCVCGKKSNAFVNRNILL